MRNTAIIVLSAALLLAGCRTTTTMNIYVVQRDVPSSPSFVVIPFNNYQSQIMCSEYAEAAMLAAGVKVIERPAPKNVEIRKGADGAQATYGKESDRIKSDKRIGAVRAFETRIERYTEYEGIKADYIVTTNGSVRYYQGVPYIESINIRILKNNTDEVLSSFVSYQYSINADMYQILKSLGVKVIPNANLE